ncbi:hypothetical protein LUZ63_017296 [Rhynchospora breviuscula]|uniref:Peroxidase n=1 Tax=Rhynchospora breviuscula TaxID=2022672 RepID=A0A9Q0C266_9POAL|nr:hypothetical protein LUZ63_017296 [Rhynchospora breviuscula]
MSWAVAFVVCLFISTSTAQLQVGFYQNSCPNAESVVASVVRQATLSDPTIPAALLRLHFHDCIVQGCEGSILIQSPATGNQEKDSSNHAGLRGFDVIDNAKAQLESQCPGIVSCADIVALAARDAITLTQGPQYDVPTGRRDGRVSNIADANSMPQVRDSINVLKSKFAAKGLSDKDLVLLSAAHTIGTTACFFLENRLYSFSTNSQSDPSINPSFLPELQAQCPQNGNVNVRIPLDRGSGNIFDIQILRNIRSGFAVIESDAALYQDDSTRAVVDSYIGLFGNLFGPSFEQDFAESMVRMGSIGVRTGSDGEIRRVCSAFN